MWPGQNPSVYRGQAVKIRKKKKKKRKKRKLWWIRVYAPYQGAYAFNGS